MSDYYSDLSKDFIFSIQKKNNKPNYKQFFELFDQAQISNAKEYTDKCFKSYGPLPKFGSTSYESFCTLLT